MRLSRRRDERGAAAVEFALVALVFFTLLFGIIQFGIWFWSWQQGAHAAREASRIAAVNPCVAGNITTAAQDALDGAPIDGVATVSVTKPSPVKVGEDISVRIQFSAADMGFFPFFDPAIDKTATSRIENVPAGGC